MVNYTMFVLKVVFLKSDFRPDFHIVYSMTLKKVTGEMLC